jgi:hypothetical protein
VAAVTTLANEPATSVVIVVDVLASLGIFHECGK